MIVCQDMSRNPENLLLFAVIQGFSLGSELNIFNIFKKEKRTCYILFEAFFWAVPTCHPQILIKCSSIKMILISADTDTNQCQG